MGNQELSLLGTSLSPEQICALQEGHVGNLMLTSKGWMVRGWPELEPYSPDVIKPLVELGVMDCHFDLAESAVTVLMQTRNDLMALRRRGSQMGLSYFELDLPDLPVPIAKTNERGFALLRWYRERKADPEKASIH